LSNRFVYQFLRHIYREMKFLPLVFACSSAQQECRATYEATCELKNGASGTVTLTQFDCNYLRYLQVTGDLHCHAEVNCDDGEHGFHVHEAAPIMQEDGTWDCAAAGGHFRKDGQEHGQIDADNRHWGAIGNIMINGSRSSMNFRDEIISLNPEDEVYIGNRGMVLHATRDDFTGLWGNAGPRVSCCVITEAVSLEETEEENDLDFGEIESGALIATGVMSLLGMFFM